MKLQDLPKEMIYLICEWLKIPDIVKLECVHPELRHVLKTYYWRIKCEKMKLHENWFKSVCENSFRDAYIRHFRKSKEYDKRRYEYSSYSIGVGGMKEMYKLSFSRNQLHYEWMSSRENNCRGIVRLSDIDRAVLIRWDHDRSAYDWRDGWNTDYGTTFTMRKIGCTTYCDGGKPSSTGSDKKLRVKKGLYDDWGKPMAPGQRPRSMREKKGLYDDW